MEGAKGRYRYPIDMNNTKIPCPEVNTDRESSRGRCLTRPCVPCTCPLLQIIARGRNVYIV